MTATEALQRLIEGNLRFRQNQLCSRNGEELAARRLEVVSGQQPFAIVLGCADSRVPIEIVFDQGIGDIFPVRVAGNIATPTQVGSIEYAAVNLGSPLVVVLGHSQCGAVQATLNELANPSSDPSPNLSAIVEGIIPAVEHLTGESDSDQLMAKAVRANVSATVRKLSELSPIISQLIDQERLQVVGAEYSLESGEVDFFDT